MESTSPYHIFYMMLLSTMFFLGSITVQEPLSSLAAEYQAGSPILLEKIKVFLLLLLLLLQSLKMIIYVCFVDIGQSIY